MWVDEKIVGGTVVVVVSVPDGSGVCSGAASSLVCVASVGIGVVSDGRTGFNLISVIGFA